MGAFRSRRETIGEIGVAPNPADPASRIVIIGGGASGTLMALALTRQRPELAVTLIDPSPVPGRGLAYDAPRPEHRRNVLPRRLSAFSDRPDDFADWLKDRGVIASTEDKVFVRRRLFGDYLNDRLGAVGHRLTLIRGSMTGIVPGPGEARVQLATGEAVRADMVILATGHSWSPSRDVDHSVPADAPVTILGTGLSMVDRWLTLRAEGHTGAITAVSRHGLVPLDHGDCPTPIALHSVPLGRPVSQTMRWLRELAAQAADWRAAVDAIRPHTQAIWQSWSTVERRRFLRHARRYWDVHRHRVAPDIGERLAEELATGTLRIVRSREFSADEHDFDCRGYLPDWSAIRNPLVCRLIEAGLVRADPLGIGLDVSADCHLMAQDGRAWPHLLAIGPITRGQFWEIEAIPDIRSQCERLGSQILAKRAVARA